MALVSLLVIVGDCWFQYYQKEGVVIYPKFSQRGR
jgi:hypothetical protein